MRTHYGPWQPCWISNQHQKHKSGRGPSSEHFWQAWLKSVQRFQRRRFKCEKLTDGRRTLTHDKSSHGLWPGELKIRVVSGLTVWIISKIKPVVWWLCIERSETVDKTLCQLAQKLLEMPSSSAAIERIFSNFGMIQSKLRNRLGLVKAGKLVFCYRMLRGKDEIDW